MVATTQLGSFIVNLGHHSKIPRGESRVFQIGDTSITVFHTPDRNVFATERTCPRESGCFLADGLVGTQKVICPIHGLAFDLSDGEPDENSCRPLTTYPAILDAEGNILVGIEAVLAAR